MKLFPAKSQQPRDAFSFLFHLTYVSLATAADTCSPWTWANNNVARTAAPAAAAEPTVTFVPSGAHVANIKRAAVVGDIVCRSPGNTYADVNYYTCTELAYKYEISLEKFFMLNPGLDPDCGNIKPYTVYCVDGFIEPLRAYDGKCGPPNKNATCVGMDAQCCNSETWTCGDSAEDCAPGTCYEGYCFGDRVYSTDGTCGNQHGGRRCAGKWGDCCNMNGKCGTGTDFCGWGKCQSGNCTIPDWVFPTSTGSLFYGNTTDGTCGGKNNYVCNELYGLCCNKDGKCGSQVSDCGAGCQPQFGKCSSASPTTTAAPTTTTSLGNGIATPTPHQTSMVSDCDDFHLVKSGDTCTSIAANRGISLANFYAWNPDVGSSTCTSLKPNYYVCVGIQSCTTNAFGLVVPQPSGASCGVQARSHGGDTIISYNSGKPISSLVNCKDACLDTVGCTNLYFAEGKYCNLHSGEETHIASSTAAYLFYDLTCFVCPSKCLSASSPPAGATCNVQALSSGGTTIISYNSGASIQSISACAATCLATSGCTNLYYTPGKYCNLHAGTETHKPSSTSQYYFYDASCFECAEPSCRTDSQGLAVPKPSGAVCNVVAYSNGGTTIVSYSSGEAIKSLKGCSAECLATSGCTNLYYEAGKHCNLHSGAETHNPNPAAPFVFYEASCFEC